MAVTTGITHAERLELPGRSPAERRNVETARAILEGFARGDFSVLPAKLAPGAEATVVGLRAERIGERARNPNWLAELFAKGLHFDIQRVAAEGDCVSIEWKDEADTSSGKIYRNEGVQFFTFDREGRVTSFREYIDIDNLLAVL